MGADSDETYHINMLLLCLYILHCIYGKMQLDEVSDCSATACEFILLLLHWGNEHKS